MKETILIAVDCGKYATKAILKSNDKHAITVFRTKMQEAEQVGIEINNGSYQVTFNGKSHLVGDTVNETYSNFDLTKKIDLHKICIYTAITDLLRITNLQAENVKIHLAVNIPISAYKDSTTKQDYKDFIENNGEPFLFSLNGNPYYLHLTDVTVVFEGVGIIYEEMEHLNGKHTAVIDIGGLNTTYCTFSGINPIFDSMTVSNLGINILKGKIGKLINERFGVTVTPNDLERILQNGYFSHAGKIYDESKELIEQMKAQHFREIIEFAKSRDYTFNNVNLDFVGGGSYMLSDTIQIEFPHARIVINPQFANVKSFLRILEIKHGL